MRVYFMSAATLLILAIGGAWIVKGSKNPDFKRWMPIAFMIAGIVAVIFLAPMVPH